MKVKINNKEVEVKYVPDNRGNSGHYETEDGEEFDGHFVLWGFSYEPKTYLKESELTGDEYRKGGTIKYFKDGKQCFEEFCRKPLIAHNKIGATLLKLMDFDWNVYKIGQKVWYRELPCVVSMLCEEQGCAVLTREDGKNFPDAVWHNKDTDGCFGEGEDTAKVEIFDNNVFWFRN